MSHCDRNFGGRNRGRFRFSSSCSSSSDENTLNFEQNEVQFIPVQLHHEGSHSKHSRHASRIRKPLTNHQMTPSNSSVYVHDSAESSRISVCFDASDRRINRKPDEDGIHFDVLLKKRTIDVDSGKRKLRSQHSVVEYTKRFCVFNLEECSGSHNEGNKTKNSRDPYSWQHTNEESGGGCTDDSFETRELFANSNSTNDPGNFSGNYRSNTLDYHNFCSGRKGWVVNSKGNVFLETSSGISNSFTREYQTYAIEFGSGINLTSSEVPDKYEKIESKSGEKLGGNAKTDKKTVRNPFVKLLSGNNEAFADGKKHSSDLMCQTYSKEFKNAPYTGMLLGNHDINIADNKLILSSTDKGNVVIFLLPVEKRSKVLQEFEGYKSTLIIPQTPSDESPLFKTVSSIEGSENNFEDCKCNKKNISNCKISDSCRLDILNFLEYPEGKQSLSTETEDSEGSNRAIYNLKSLASKEISRDTALGGRKALVSLLPLLLLPNSGMHEDTQESLLSNSSNQTFNEEKFICETKNSPLIIKPHMNSIFHNIDMLEDSQDPNSSNYFEGKYTMIEPDIETKQKLEMFSGCETEVNIEAGESEKRKSQPENVSRIEEALERFSNLDSATGNGVDEKKLSQIKEEIESNVEVLQVVNDIVKENPSLQANQNLGISGVIGIKDGNLKKSGTEIIYLLKDRVILPESELGMEEELNENNTKNLDEAQISNSVCDLKETKLLGMDEKKKNTNPFQGEPQEDVQNKEEDIDMDVIRDILLNCEANEEEINTDSITIMSSRLVDETVIETKDNIYINDSLTLIGNNTEEEISLEIDSMPFESASEKNFIVINSVSAKENREIILQQELALQNKQLKIKESKIIDCTSGNSYFSKEASTQKNFDLDTLRISYASSLFKPEQSEKEAQTEDVRIETTRIMDKTRQQNYPKNEAVGKMIAISDNFLQTKDLHRKYNMIQQANLNAKRSKSIDILFFRKYMTSNSEELDKLPKIRNIGKCFLRRWKSAPQLFSKEKNEEKQKLYDLDLKNIERMNLFLTSHNIENFLKIHQERNIGQYGVRERKMLGSDLSIRTIFTKNRSDSKKSNLNEFRFQKMKSTETKGTRARSRLKQIGKGSKLEHKTRQKSEKFTLKIPENKAQKRKYADTILGMMENANNLSAVEEHIEEDEEYARINKLLNLTGRFDHDEYKHRLTQKLLRQNENDVKDYKNKLDIILSLKKRIMNEKIKQKTMHIHDKRTNDSKKPRVKVLDDPHSVDRTEYRGLKRRRLSELEMQPSLEILKKLVQLKPGMETDKIIPGSSKSNNEEEINVCSKNKIKSVDSSEQLAKSLLNEPITDIMKKGEEFTVEEDITQYNNINLLSNRTKKKKSSHKVVVPRSKHNPGSYLAIYSKRSKLMADKNLANPLLLKNKRVRHLDISGKSLKEFEEINDCELTFKKTKILVDSANEENTNLKKIEHSDDAMQNQEKKQVIISNEENANSTQRPPRSCWENLKKHNKHEFSLTNPKTVKFSHLDDSQRGSILSDCSKLLKFGVNAKTEPSHLKSREDISKKFIKRIRKKTNKMPDIDEICRILAELIPKQIPPSMQLQNQPDVPVKEPELQRRQPPLFEKIGKDDKFSMSKTTDEKNKGKSGEKNKKTKETSGKKIRRLNSMEEMRTSRRKNVANISESKSDGEITWNRRKQSRGKSRTRKIITEQLGRSEFSLKSGKSIRISQKKGIRSEGQEIDQNLKIRKSKKCDKGKDDENNGKVQMRKLNGNSRHTKERGTKKVDEIELKLKDKEKSMKKLRRNSSNSIKLAILPKWRKSKVDNKISIKEDKRATGPEGTRQIRSKHEKDKDIMKIGVLKQEKSLKKLEEPKIKIKIDKLGTAKKNEPSKSNEKLKTGRNKKQVLDSKGIEYLNRIVFGKKDGKKIEEICFSEIIEKSPIEQSKLKKTDSFPDSSDEDVESLQSVESNSSSLKELSIKESKHNRKPKRMKHRKKRNTNQTSHGSNESGDEIEDFVMSRITQYSLMDRKKRKRKSKRAEEKCTNNTSIPEPGRTQQLKEDLGDGDNGKLRNKYSRRSILKKIRDLDRVNKLEKIFMDEYKRRVFSKCNNCGTNNVKCLDNGSSSNLGCCNREISDKDGETRESGRNPELNQVNVYTLSALHGLFSKSEIEFLDGMKRHFGIKNNASTSKKLGNIWKKESKSDGLPGVFSKSEDKFFSQLKAHFKTPAPSNTKVRKPPVNYKERVNDEKRTKKHVRFDCPKKYDYEFSPRSSRACIKRPTSDVNSRDKRNGKHLFDQMMEENIQKLKKKSKNRHSHVFYEDKRLDISQHEKKKAKKSKVKNKQSEEKKKPLKKQKSRKNSLIKNSYQISYLIEIKTYNSIFLNQYISKTLCCVEEKVKHETKDNEIRNEGLNNVVTFIRTDILRENRSLLDDIIGPNISLKKLFKKLILQDE